MVAGSGWTGPGFGGCEPSPPSLPHSLHCLIWSTGVWNEDGQLPMSSQPRNINQKACAVSWVL